MGLLTGAPIAALYAALWTPAARRAFPALEDMHKAECDPLDALFEGMTPAQVCFPLPTCVSCFYCFSKHPFTQHSSPGEGGLNGAVSASVCV